MPRSFARSATRVAAALILSAICGFAHADILRVGFSPTCDYPSDALQSAIDDAREGDIVELEPGVYLTPASQAWTLRAKRLSLLGGFSCATGEHLAGSTVLHSDGTRMPILQLRRGAVPNYVELADLTIENGAAGGIYIDGGYLGLSRVHVSANRNGGDLSTDNGAGIGIVATTDPVQVVMHQGVLVSGNTAELGGGVYVKSTGTAPAVLTMTEPGSSIAFNYAGSGGGLYLDGANARADVASDGFDIGTGRYAAVHGNYADRNGAGIAAVNGALVRLFSTTPGSPVRIEANGRLQADGVAPTQFGGGIYAAISANVCGWNYSINHNKAVVGAALYGADAGLNFFRHEALELCGPDPALAAGALDCSVGAPCNFIDDNQASGGSHGIIDVNGAGYLNLERVEMYRNSGSALLLAYANTKVVTCIVGRNDAGQSPYVIANVGAPLTLDGCTIAHNVFLAAGAASGALSAFGPMNLSRSLVWSPALSALAVGGNGHVGAQDSLVDHIAQWTGLADTSNVNELLDPRFVDANASNYHLQPDSPAIDYSALVFPGELDLDSRPRSVGGRFDVGAYESDHVDTIFASGFD